MHTVFVLRLMRLRRDLKSITDFILLLVEADATYNSREYSPYLRLYLVLLTKKNTHNAHTFHVLYRIFFIIGLDTRSCCRSLYFYKLFISFYTVRYTVGM